MVATTANISPISKQISRGGRHVLFLSCNALFGALLIGLLLAGVFAQASAAPAASAPAFSAVAGSPKAAAPVTPASATVGPLTMKQLSQTYFGLSVSPQKGVTISSQSRAVYQAGAINPVKTPTITQTFILHNDTHASLTISRLRPSCHCTTAVFLAPSGSEAAPVLPVTLAPGGQVTVRVTVNLKNKPAGPLSKQVYVFLTQDFAPAAILGIDATLTQSGATAPSAVSVHPAGNGPVNP